MGILMLNGNNYTGGIQQVYGSSSGDIATFDDGGDNKPLKSLKVAINPVQSGSGDPSPTNVRPISGWDEVNVTRCGKNLFGISIDKDTPYTNIYLDNPIGQTITVSAVNNSVTVSEPAWIIAYVKKDETITYIGDSSYGTPFPQTITATAENPIVRIQYRGITITSGSFDVQTELGNQANTYEPYNGTTYTIQLGDTYYGGELDVTSGVLTVTHANIASYNGESINEPWISSEDAYESGATPTTGAQVVYPLTTPLTVQLTPTQITTLLGDNNIMADSGEILECVYQRDLNLVINQFDARITALEQALNSSGTRSLSLSKSAVNEEETNEEITEEPKEEEQNEDKR